MVGSDMPDPTCLVRSFALAWLALPWEGAVQALFSPSHWCTLSICVGSVVKACLQSGLRSASSQVKLTQASQVRPVRISLVGQ